jgi:NADH-quinone oxidoreductase subunit C
MNIAQTLELMFPDAILESQEFRGEITIIVDGAKIIEVCQYCRNTEGLEFNFLSDITGIDYLPKEPRFGILYHLYSLTQNHSLRLKVLLPGDEPRVYSVTSIYPAANWSEREIFDLFGVTFENHPDLRRLLMPDGWDGHPLRKDYPLGYETVQFSFNFDEVDQHKPYARE